MSVADKISYSYIKNIKRWMECPLCHDKMTFDKNNKSWSCNKCNYEIMEEEFLDDFVFWFCDECNAYLNAQEGFDKKQEKHTCRNCGYENDITNNNIKGECKDCGKKLDEKDLFLCEECKQIRKQKAKEWMMSTTKKVAKDTVKAAVVLGTSLVTAKVLKSVMSDDTNDEDSKVEDNATIRCKSCGALMTEFDGVAWHTCSKCGESARVIDGDITWQDEIFKSGEKEFHSDFELADFCHGGDLTED